MKCFTCIINNEVLSSKILPVHVFHFTYVVKIDNNEVLFTDFHRYFKFLSDSDENLVIIDILQVYLQ